MYIIDHRLRTSGVFGVAVGGIRNSSCPTEHWEKQSVINACE